VVIAEKLFKVKGQRSRS